MTGIHAMQSDSGAAAAGVQYAYGERLRVSIATATLLCAQQRTVEAVNELMTLHALCKSDVESLVMLMGVALECRAFGLAEDFLISIKTLSNPPPVHEVHKVQLQAHTNLWLAREQLQALGAATYEDFAFWQKLTDIAERLGEGKIALKAAENAFSLTGGTFEARKRLVGVQVANGERRAALRHLKLLADDPKSGGPIARRFAEQASACGDQSLAIEFAGKWVAMMPGDIDAHILAAQMLAQHGQFPDAASAMDKVVSLAEQGTTPSHGQFTTALDVARLIGGDVARRVAKAALLAYPGNPSFAAFVSSGSLFANRPGAIVAPRAPARPKSRILGWLGFADSTKSGPD